MNKIEVANELLKNSSDCFKEDIKGYLEEIKVNNLSKCSFIKEWDLIIEYISNSKFDITGWQVFEIPVAHSLFCFFNEMNSKYFDLYVDNNSVLPCYVDDKSNQRFAETINEAVLNFRM